VATIRLFLPHFSVSFCFCTDDGATPLYIASTTDAAEFGHTALLRWAREHGCPETGGGATHAGAMASPMPSLWRRFRALLAALSFPDGVDEGGRYASEDDN